MKNSSIVTSYVVLILAFLFLGCNSDDDQASEMEAGLAPEGTIIAVVNNEEFQSVANGTRASVFQDDQQKYNFSIKGDNGVGGNSSKVIEFQILSDKSLGEFDINSEEDFVLASYTGFIVLDTGEKSFGTWTSASDSSSGKIEITKLTDTEIEGSFDFKLTRNSDGDMIELERGSFNLAF